MSVGLCLASAACTQDAPVDGDTVIAASFTGGNGPTFTDFVVLTNAKSVNRSTPDGTKSIDWYAVGSAEQDNGQGAVFQASNELTSCWLKDPKINTSYSDHLYLTNAAGLNLPADAVVLGVEVEVTMKKVGWNPTLEVIKLFGPRGASAGSRHRPIDLTPSFQPYSFGGQSDRWGEKWDPEVFNSPEFGIRLRMSGRHGCVEGQSDPVNTAAHVDFAQVRIKYRQGFDPNPGPDDEPDDEDHDDGSGARDPKGGPDDENHDDGPRRPRGEHKHESGRR